MEKRKIAIFGSGAIGKKAYYMLQEEYEIVKFYDNNDAKVGTQIDGIPIVKWNGTYDGILIVIALLQYEQVVEQLAKCGLRPVTDFTLWKNFYPFEELSYFDFYKMEIACGKKIDYQNFLPKRKLAVVFGNCQTSVLDPTLEKNMQLSISLEFLNLYMIKNMRRTLRMTPIFGDRLICLFIKRYQKVIVFPNWLPRTE